MFLKSLTLRGFKSFADKTTLQFEPGITIVVGPNGSGKSNVVDAISWVLGEQGPRSLRGSKMEDVIFAGSRTRPALAMAEVSLTIDNSAGLLPIEFAEVTVSRVLFRSGDSEYRLNGAPCRLLDIQEVLSDTGIGREQHTIISQGQLDEVLSADPMQMRGFIEEAAGVAKHRRRKDRAIRKIASTEQNLVRLSDLLSEVRRQLRPLREQAEVAKRHLAIDEELARIRLVAAARELSEAGRMLGEGSAIDLDQLISEKETELSAAESTLTELEQARARAQTESDDARGVAWGFERSVERLRGIQRLAEERSKAIESELAATTEASAQAQVNELKRQAAEVQRMLAAAKSEAEAAESLLAERKRNFEMTGAEASAIERAVAPLKIAHRDLASDSVRIRGEIAALEGSREARVRERDDAGTKAADLRRRIDDVSSVIDREKSEAQTRERQEEDLSRKLEESSAVVAGLEAEFEQSRSEAMSLEREVATWRARAEMRETSLSTIESLLSIDGVEGTLAGLTDAASLKAALDAVAGNSEAVLIVGDSSVAEAVEGAADEDVPLAMLIARHEAAAPCEGVRPLSEEVRATGAARDALNGVYLAESFEQAAALAAAHPGCTFVTRSGAVASGAVAARGPSSAAERSRDFQTQLEAARSRVAEIQERLEAASADQDRWLRDLGNYDSQVAASLERLSSGERELHALERELAAVLESRESVSQATAEIDRKLEELRVSVPDVEARLERFSAEIERFQTDAARAEAAVATASALVDEARLTAARARERSKLLEERWVTVDTALDSAALAASGVAERRKWLVGAAASARAVAQTAASFQPMASSWAGSVEAEHSRIREDLASAETEISAIRIKQSRLSDELREIRRKARDEDLGRSELKIRSRILEEKMREEWKVDPQHAVSTYGHIWETEDPSTISDPIGRVAAMDDESLRKRRNRLEQSIAQMGNVNPLAAQEFEALTQREEFLASQISDVRSSRRDLFKVVSSVDEQIRELFGAAFADVAGEYEHLFSVLFPGGQGRLRLTEPADLLHTGVEIEARPGGKNVKKLSLLSGGERALSALAVLFAIFRARPSPFYVLDEVEAALDDVNLHRFIELLKEFRRSSQLLVVTHQKRTMESADVLYGVSIRTDGASRVISQKLGGPSEGSQVSGRVISTS